jgi:hypothetical protein
MYLATHRQTTQLPMNVILPAICALLCAQTALGQSSAGQELVHNGGFELINKEPTTYDQVPNAEGWGNVTIGLSEVFSKEAPAKTVGVPDNDYGKIEPFEGDHYAGFFAWKDDMKRNYEEGQDEYVPGWNAYSEYVISELVSPLVEGQEYEITFHVALSGNSDRAVMGIGAYCALENMKQQHRHFLSETPQVSVDSIVGEKGVWKAVKGRFVADGGERFIVIGTFTAAGFDSKRCIEGPDNKYAYYYLDGISLKAVPKE